MWKYNQRWGCVIGNTRSSHHYQHKVLQITVPFFVVVFVLKQAQNGSYQSSILFCHLNVMVCCHSIIIYVYIFHGGVFIFHLDDWLCCDVGCFFYCGWITESSSWRQNTSRIQTCLWCHIGMYINFAHWYYVMKIFQRSDHHDISTTIIMPPFLLLLTALIALTQYLYIH